MSFIDHFQTLEDPRSHINRRHELLDVLFLTLSAVLAGAEGWKDIKDFGDEKLDWLRQFREFKHGIPVDDTIARIISALDARKMMACFIGWVNEIRTRRGSDLIAIDGKTFRRAHTAKKSDALHTLCAWSKRNGVVLAQMKSEGKKNEIATAQKMIEMLELAGATVSLDAMHCQRKTAAAIIKRKGHYVLNVKTNQKGLHEAVVDVFSGYEEHGALPRETVRHDTLDAGHGRIETRRYEALPVPEWMDKRTLWQGMKSIIRVTRVRELKEGTTQEIMYYISSHTAEDLGHIADAIRSHWEIENKVHWVLDVTYREDSCRIRRGDGAENIGLLRRMCLNLSRLHPKKDSMRGKLKAAGWSDHFREELLFGCQP